jgi:twitching motility protein PilT
MELKMLDLAKEVVKYSASDLHIAVGRRVTLRVKSKLMPFMDVDILDKKTVDNLLHQVLSDEDFDMLYQGHELDFALSFSDTMRFRVNAFLTRGNPALAMRYLQAKIKTVEELNLPPIFHHFAQLMQGFILLTGPTGSGKTTTLAAVIDEINHNRAENIITIEDPIEYIFEEDKSMISQREIGVDSISFERALVAAFREDVDVILLGEMRDLETMRTSVTASETGHLVFSTLHTNSASQSINRIIDMFPASQQIQVRSQLASSLEGIVAQRLIPTVDGDLVPAVEILLSNNAVRSLIREGRIYQIDTILETHLKDGMMTLNHSLLGLIKSGRVSYETALRFSNDPVTLRNIVQRSNI